MTTTPDTKPKEEVQRKHRLAKCEECPLYQYGIARTSFPTSPTGVARAAVVSRSPGYHDVIAGAPFSGPSGDVLNHLLRQQGVKREEVLVTNVVLCAPPEGKVPPKAIEACAPRLIEELKGYTTILAAGAEAVNSLVGRGTIDHYRGYRIKRGNRTFVATNNPALVLRDDSTFPNLVKDFRRAFNPLSVPKMPKVLLLEGEDDALKALENIIAHKSTYVSADIESRGGLSHKAELVCIQFSVDANQAYVIGEPVCRSNKVLEGLRSLFSSTTKRFVWHNGIFDTKILRYGYDIPARVDEDTLLLSYAVDERGGVHELEYLLMEEFGWPNYVPGSVSSFKKTGRLVSEKEEKELAKAYDGERFEREFAKLERQNYLNLYKYGGYDAAGTYQLFELLSERSHREATFDKPYRSTLIAANEVIHQMEVTGMPYDYHKAAELLEKVVNPELHSILVDLREATGKELLNPASPQQMAALYYDEWQVGHVMRFRPDKQRSVDDSARKEITDGRFNFAGEHSAVMIGNKMEILPSEAAAERRTLIQSTAEKHDRFQKLNKQAGTYLRSLIERAEADPDYRIYTSLLRHGTTSARLASRGPNLQNVTRTKEGLPDIRGLFFAHDGYLLVQADYSQAELRAIAALSGDRLLGGVYERRESLHKLTAERFFGKDYTGEQYSTAKNCNFGGFYGQSPASFQEKHGIDPEQAEKYIEWMWKTFTGVKEWAKEVRKDVHRNKSKEFNYNFIESPFGHRRRFYLITQENRNAVYREAINFLPQNIAANLTLHACIRLQEEVDTRRARLCLTVHDSILAQVEEEYVEEYTEISEQIMVAQAKDLLNWSIPFEVEIGSGKTWATAK